MSEFKRYATQGLFTQFQNALRDFDRQLLLMLEDILTNLNNLLNRGLTFTDNLDGADVSYTSNAIANTEDTIPHTLGRAPVKFFVVDLDKGGVVYRGGTTFTSTNIYLKCTVASANIKLFIF